MNRVPTIFREAIEQSYDSIMITTAELERPGPRILYVNPAVSTMTGYTASELIGETPRMLQGPDTDRAVLDRLRHCLRTGDRFEGEAINYRKDGSTYWVRWHVSTVSDPEWGQCFLAIQRDITERVRQEHELRLLSQAFETGQGVLITDAHANIQRVNAAFTEITGYPQEEILGRNPNILQSGETDADVYRQMWADLERQGHWTGEIWNRRRDGTLIPESETITAVHDEHGRVTNYVAVFQDISERKRLEEELHQQAFFDRLTELANRRHMEEALDREMERARRYDTSLSLMLIDIDHFKSVNDEHGHEVGDEVLARFARLVEGQLRDADLLGRWGGEEFLILLPHTQLEQALEVGERIRNAVSRAAFPTVGSLTLSGGLTEYRGGEPRRDLIQRVDAALYTAKTAGRNRLATGQ